MVRTSKKTMTFRRPFVLGGLDEVLPAGAYSVETDEELLEGISFPAYRRVLTLIRLHAKSGNPHLSRALTIDPNELDAALKRDQAPADDLVCRDAHPETLTRATKPRQEEADRQAMDRAEDEGMIVHPV
ncbi:MAG: hypothetical protein OEQ29_12375 [Alphaproteobacteria bacterium]|nr:hypothetical protein [Alphaproteobacteria bacterium]